MNDRQTDLSFADRAAPLALRDPLAELLGVLPPGGTFRYTFEDAVKLCGHSCPTVAAAWLMTAAALETLYPDQSPVRGQIEVTVGGAADDGGSGPMALVVCLVTGAAPETGFGGLMGRYSRKDLLRFDPRLEGRMRFRRTDTGATVVVSVDRSRIPMPPEMPALMSATLAGRASPEDARRFATLWQSRVESMLTDRKIVKRDK
ncbi:MAG: hypothetical protein HYY06_09335 [Deltaproteobacteria bacterium]|nr:hypothetical protein [Deltaproteobacteria bacterium]